MLAGAGYGDEAMQGEGGTTESDLNLTPEQITAIVAGGEAIIGATSDAIRRNRESMKGLIKQRSKLKKKIARTKDKWKKQRYKDELAHVNYQIEQLELMLAADSSDIGGGELPWLLILAVVAVGGIVVVAATRKKRKKAE
jgi:Spy/CpxP family protein refolding chaperone